MPAVTSVMDGFKNLIRHGKHHNHARQEQPSRDPLASASPPHYQQDTSESSPDPTAKPTPTVHHRRHRDDPASPPISAAPASQQAITRDVEIIVQEEREAKSKMPVYKGLERFTLIDKMGDGAFSNVYKALDSTTNQKIAVKIVRKYELNASQDQNKHLNPNFKKRPRVTERANILKEVQIMRGTNHPSIVKLLSFSESEEHYYLVLELLEGGELFHQIVKLTYFSENLSRHVILQVAHGIRYLHEERGVVHRDIKPENLLFQRIPIIPSKNPIRRPYDEEKEDEGEFVPGVGGGGIGRVKIADFGLSKVIWNEETMTPCGTVGYTAPEIVKDERYSKSVDMWALGCVLYTLLCGFPPFYDESINVLTEKVARGYYTFLSPWWDDINASAKDLITHLLCVDPAQRYTIDEFLAHPWCNAAPAPPPPPTPAAYHGAALDSPLLADVRGGLPGGRSPGLASLKEAFDITYAVHRMEEEGARRRAYNGPGGAGVRGFLNRLNEDDESTENGQLVLDQARVRHGEKPNASQPHGPRDTRSTKGRDDVRILGEGRAGPRDRGRRHDAGTFSLDLDGATLLGRRKRGSASVTTSSPLARNPAATAADDTVDAPQSPMHF